MTSSGPSPLLVVFGVTTLALAVGVPLMLLRERVDRPRRFAVIAMLLYLGVGFGARAMLLRDAIEPDHLDAALERGDIGPEEHADRVAAALDVRAQSTRTGMGLGLMSAIGFAWMIRIAAGRKLQQSIDAGPERRLIVGCACALCDEVIAMEIEGKHCAKCGVPLHKRCRAKHRAAAHPAAEPRRMKRVHAPQIDLHVGVSRYAREVDGLRVS
jgi:hypothetical protein